MGTEDETTKAAVGTGATVSDTSPDESDAVLRELRKKLEPRIRAFRESERLSEEDFAIRINVRD